MEGLTFMFMGFEVTPVVVDSLNRIFLLAFTLGGAVVLAYGYGMTRDIKHTLISAAYIFAAFGCVLAGDFFSLLVFWELMMVTSLVLIVYDGRARSFEAGFRYLLLHVISGVSLLLAVIIQYVATGDMQLAVPVAGALPFFMVAAGVKGAMIPLHVWVVDAYSSSMPASAVVMSAFTTKVGVYSVARILTGNMAIAYMGGAMAIFGVTMALAQTNLRRLLSFHIVSQVGYMMAGVALGSAAGMDGGTLHLFNNVMYKTLLFMVAGSVWFRVKSENAKKLGGLARSMPITFACGLVGALSISGMPPFNGFVSKSMLDAAAGAYPVLQVMLFAAGIGTVMSFTKFIYYTFLHEPAEDHSVREAPASLWVPMVFLAAVCIGTGVSYAGLASLLPTSTVVTVYEAGKILKCILVVVGGAGLFFLIRSLIDAFGRWAAIEPERFISTAVDGVVALSRSIMERGREEEVQVMVVVFALIGAIILFW